MNSKKSSQYLLELTRVKLRHGILGICLAIAFCILSAGGSWAQEAGLLAHDINGYHLDMTVEQVAAVAHKPLVSLGYGQYQVKSDGIDYNFGFSVLGHLYRIDSEQQLGGFIPDKAFAETLTDKLSKKFGPLKSNLLPTGPAGSEYLEMYTDTMGQNLRRVTESLSVVLLGGYGQPVSLDTKLMDFRIMRRDIAAANAAPRSRAENAAKF